MIHSKYLLLLYSTETHYCDAGLIPSGPFFSNAISLHCEYQNSTEILDLIARGCISPDLYSDIFLYYPQSYYPKYVVAVSVLMKFKLFNFIKLNSVLFFAQTFLDTTRRRETEEFGVFMTRSKQYHHGMRHIHCRWEPNTTLRNWYWFFIPHTLMWCAILFNFFFLSPLQQPWIQEVCRCYLLKKYVNACFAFSPQPCLFFHPQGIT